MAEKEVGNYYYSHVFNMQIRVLFTHLVADAVIGVQVLGVNALVAARVGGGGGR